VTLRHSSGQTPRPESRQGSRIDLHLHSTASDGRLTPAQLVDAVDAAGVSTMALTDHDTLAGIPEVAALCERAGIELVPGIEITAVENGRDVHVLGYFVEIPGGNASRNLPSTRTDSTSGDDRRAGLAASVTGGPAASHAASTDFATFLAAQREGRLERIEEIVRRLAALGMPLDLTALLSSGGPAGRSVGRPIVARALVAGGYVASVAEAFDRWLGIGCPAFVPRNGAPVAHVIETIHHAGGLASLAHPGRTRLDDRLEELCGAGLDALEVFHSDHAPEVVAHYRQRARELGVLMTGGSDFHGEPERDLRPGSATLPHEEWARLSDARRRHARA
jgi:3',5'-nucleoside bisphosphate phosphatase